MFLSLQKSRKKHCFFTAVRIVLGALWLGAHAATAQDASALEVRVQAELRVTEHDGKLTTYRYVPAKQFPQGQELYYTVRVRNVSASAIRDAEVVQPIPEHTHYVANSATGAGADITFSIDGGKTFAAPEQLRKSRTLSIDSTDGVATVKRALTRDYTHIRWRLQHPLEPGAVVLARFRVVFD